MSSSGEKDEPSSCDAVAPDANCCIKSVLLFDNLESDYYASYINEFLKDCYNRDTEVVLFDFVRDEADKNLAPAVDELMEDRGVNSKERGYIRSKLVPKARKKLEEKFNKWTQCGKLNPNIDKIRKLFKEFEKDIEIESGEKKNIPEDNDLRLIGCLDKTDCETGYILSQDAHFCQYEDEIENEFPHNLLILELENLTQLRISWGWT